MPIVGSADYGTELVIVQNDRYAVLTSAGKEDGRVLAEYVRIIDKEENGHEIVMWTLDEIDNDLTVSPEDPTTSFNAILSAIELVATNQFPPPHFAVKNSHVNKERK